MICRRTDHSWSSPFSSPTASRSQAALLPSSAGMPRGWNATAVTGAGSCGRLTIGLLGTPARHGAPCSGLHHPLSTRILHMHHLVRRKLHSCMDKPTACRMPASGSCDPWNTSSINPLGVPCTKQAASSLVLNTLAGLSSCPPCKRRPWQKGAARACAIGRQRPDLDGGVPGAGREGAAVGRPGARPDEAAVRLGRAPHQREGRLAGACCTALGFLPCLGNPSVGSEACFLTEAGAEFRGHRTRGSKWFHVAASTGPLRAEDRNPAGHYVLCADREHRRRHQALACWRHKLEPAHGQTSLWGS